MKGYMHIGSFLHNVQAALQEIPFSPKQLFTAHKIPHKFLNFLSLVQIFVPFQKRLFQLE